MVAAPETLTPLSARSTVLSLMLGSHPGALTTADLTRAGRLFGIEPATVRVAVARAVADGDLRRTESGLRLGERLAGRQRHQDEAVLDAETAWDGTWEMAVVVVAGRPGPERAALRDVLADHRLAELREGVWTRPANLRRPRDYAADPVLRTFRSHLDQDPVELAAGLWDLPAWAATGERLLRTMASTDEPAPRLSAAAAIVRQLASDPLLPAELLPRGWPAPRLREAYRAYQDELRDLARLGSG